MWSTNNSPPAVHDPVAQEARDTRTDTSNSPCVRCARRGTRRWSTSTMWILHRSCDISLKQRMLASLLEGQLIDVVVLVAFLTDVDEHLVEARVRSASPFASLSTEAFVDSVTSNPASTAWRAKSGV